MAQTFTNLGKTQNLLVLDDPEATNEDAVEAPAGEPPLDFWTDFDWEQLCMIQNEEMVLWNQLPDDVKQKGEAFLMEMNTPEGQARKDQEDIEDFNVSDADRDGRLSYAEYKTMQKRIYDLDVERFGDYILYNEEQLDKRYKFMCSLAKSLDGPTQQTFAKLKKMVMVWMELMGIRSQLKGEAPDESFERTWSVEELGEVMTVAQEGFAVIDAMPEEVKNGVYGFTR